MKKPDEIKKGLSVCSDVEGNCPYCPYAINGRRDLEEMCIKELVNDAWHNIKLLEAQVPKWISVKDEQKPKHCEQVLCTYVFDGCPERYVGVLNYYAYGDNGYATEAHFTDEGMYDMRVTHWMPLPEPPKEDGHAQE